MSASSPPRAESAVDRVRRMASLWSARIGRAGLVRRQREQNGGRPAAAAGPPADESWTTARLLAVNLVVLCALAALLMLFSSLIEHVTRQAFVVVFALITVSLVRRGTRLRRRGAQRLGQSITAWAGITGSLVVLSGALSLHLTSFVPDLIALTAGWLLVLGVWKNLPGLVTAAVILVVPIVWGALVWDRSLVGGLLILVAAGAYARAGTVRRTLFGALVVSAVVLLAATVHQLTHAGAAGFDGSDLLTLTIVVVCLAAAGELDSWHEDWLAYGWLLRRFTAVAALALAAVADQRTWLRSWVATTPPSALARVVVAGTVAMIVVWVAVTVRPARPGGRARLASWTLATLLLLGALTGAFGVSVVRWVAVVVLAFWGLRTMRDGVRRSRAASVAGGFAVVLGAVLPVATGRPGLTPLVLILLAVAAATAVIVPSGRPGNRVLLASTAEPGDR